ncbi:MAG TPA: hypothetical protein VES36_03495 [Candidatus Limnocylindrales bacterium]|nr:hypothetical protein [Candidatus Limnocylindrales bacterium]
MGWLAAGALLVALAFVVGGPAAEQGVLGGTPSPGQPSPLPIRFGQGLDPDTNRAIHRTRRFRSGDRFAYSVTMASAPSTADILVEISRLQDGRAKVVQPKSVQHILPKVRTFAFAVRADDLLAAWGAGSYEMRIFIGDGDTPLAVGRFMLIAPPAPG